MKVLVTILTSVFILIVPLTAQQDIRIGVFSRNAVSLAADEGGFMKDEGIVTSHIYVRDSVELMSGLADGTFDIIHTAADNVIAWAEGQGQDEQKHDFVIFVGGSRNVGLDLVVNPDIHDFEDLRGRTMAVDALNTGYAPILVYMLAQHNLYLGKDYRFESVGGATQRTQSLLEESASGAFVRLNQDLIGKGFWILANSQDYLSNYALAIGATRRAWTTEHKDLLVRYIRALVKCTDWLLDPKNSSDVLDVLNRATDQSAERARRLYQQAVDPNLGLLPKANIDLEGLRTVIHLRGVMGEMEEPLPDPEKYVDESFYLEAITDLN